MDAGEGAGCGLCAGAAGRPAKAVARLEDDAPRCSSDPRRLDELTPFKLGLDCLVLALPGRTDVPYSLVMLASYRHFPGFGVTNNESSATRSMIPAGSIALLLEFEFSSLCTADLWVPAGQHEKLTIQL